MAHTNAGNIQIGQIKSSDLSGGLNGDKIVTVAGAATSGYALLFDVNGDAVATATTGSGSVVRATSPTLVTPVLGTPTSGTLTNATGLPLTTGVTGTLPVANGGSGTASTLTGIVRGGSPMTAAELSGDATTSGSNAV